MLYCDWSSDVCSSDLAFLKATDTRQNASFAIRLPSRREDRRGAALAPKSTDEWEADDEED